MRDSSINRKLWVFVKSELIAEGVVTRPPSGREVDGNLLANFQTEGASAYTEYPVEIKQYWLLYVKQMYLKKIRKAISFKVKTDFYSYV